MHNSNQKVVSLTPDFEAQRTAFNSRTPAKRSWWKTCPFAWVTGTWLIIITGGRMLKGGGEEKDVEWEGQKKNPTFLLAYTVDHSHPRVQLDEAGLFYWLLSWQLAVSRVEGTEDHPLACSSHSQVRVTVPKGLCAPNRKVDFNKTNGCKWAIWHHRKKIILVCFSNQAY